MNPEQIFAELTAKQREVIALVADNRTTKEIGYQLDVSDSAVNQRINTLRAKFGGVPRSELARLYRMLATPALAPERAPDPSHRDGPQGTCQELTGENLQLQPSTQSKQLADQDDTSGVFSLADAIQFGIDTPWQEAPEHRIVPRLLDGANSLLVRGALIAVATLSMLMGMVAVVGLAQGLTAILGG
jgi:DNA-binding CsgD family transcriptional regulator